MQSLSILSEVILEIKTEIAKIVADEREALEISSDVVKAKTSTSSGGMPVSRFTVHKPRQKGDLPLQPSEKLSDDDLVALTMNAIQDSYKARWQSLSVPKKKDRIKEFATEYIAGIGLSSERVKDLYDILYEKIMIDKSLKVKDLAYDESIGKLVAISQLKYEQDEFRFVKPSKHEQAEDIARTENSVVVPGPASSVTSSARSRPVVKSKIEKTMARIKRKS